MVDFGVISISSSDEEEKVIKSRKRSSTPPKVLKKKRMKADIIILTDEEDPDLIEKNGLNPEVSIENSNGLHEQIDKADGNNSDTSNLDDNIDKPSCYNTSKDLVEEIELTDEDSIDSTIAHHSTSTIQSTEPIIELCDELKEFLKLCESSIETSLTKQILLSKIPYLKSVCNKSPNYVESTIFIDDVKKKISQLRDNPSKAIQLFGSIVKDIKSNQIEHNNEKLAKLERTLRKLQGKINKLSSADVAWSDDEEDSAYIQLDSYTKKAVQIHNKICKITETDPNYGQPYFGRLDFGGSNYSQINHMINKKYQDRSKRPFPVFDQLDFFIRRCVEKHSINISAAKLDFEVRSCFEALGVLLQKRRRQDLAGIHHGYLESVTDDPAKSDLSLRSKLDEHRKEHFLKLNEIEKKYVTLQHIGNTSQLSVDSDDSVQEEEEYNSSD